MSVARIFFLPVIIAVLLSATTTLAVDLTGDWRAVTGENFYIRQAIVLSGGIVSHLQRMRIGPVSLMVSSRAIW
jgi:hypothetical protein